MVASSFSCRSPLLKGSSSTLWPRTAESRWIVCKLHPVSEAGGSIETTRQIVAYGRQRRFAQRHLRCSCGGFAMPWLEQASDLTPMSCSERSPQREATGFCIGLMPRSIGSIAPRMHKARSEKSREVSAPLQNLRHECSGEKQMRCRNRLYRLKYQIIEMVGAEGFEPPTLCSQSRCATRLRYAPML